MNKIDWSKGFVGVDGRKRYQRNIERWYLRELLVKSKGKKIRYNVYNSLVVYYGRIQSRLIALENKSEFGEIGSYILRSIISNLPHILLAKPETLESITILYKIGLSILEKELKSTSPKKTVENFNEEIRKAFGYDSYRGSILPTLAEYINVKCCPYCNMHYTMLTYEDMDEQDKDRLTEFQFDHFFDKSSYPLLSMSLYNLVPSCANCNHTKRTKTFSLDFHPYHSDISKLFRFDIKGGKVGLFFGGTTDIVKIKLVANDPKKTEEIEKYDKDLNISSIYGRHRDVIEEIAAKIYIDSYYSENGYFQFLKHPDLIKKISQNILNRVRFGNYDKPEDIHKRPMAKFRQDIYQSLLQAYSLGNVNPNP